MANSEVPTSALATCEPTLDPFFPGAATLNSEIALTASLLISVLPEPTAPLRVQQGSFADEKPRISPHDHDLVLTCPLHIVVGIEGQPEHVRSKLLLDHIVTLSSGTVVDCTAVVFGNVVLQ